MPGFRGFPRTMLSLALSLAAVAADRAATAQEAKLYVTSSLPIILGESEKVSLVIEVPETPETEGRPLQLTSNVGRVDQPERVGRGKYRAHYYLPATKYPQSAMIAVWREAGADSRVDFLRIPLSARTKLPFKAMPGTECRAFVGSEVYGPEIADKKGNAAIPIIVPPGVREVVVETTDRNSNKKRSTVPVRVPPYNRLAMAVVPYMTEGKYPVVVHVYYDDETSPPTADKLRLVVPSGSTRLLGANRNRYRFEYRAQPTMTDKDVTLSVAVTGDDTSGAHTSLLFGSPVAERILSRTSSTSLAANGVTTKMIRALVIDHYGMGVSGLQIKPTTTDGTIGPVRDAGNGYYEAMLTAPSAVPRGRKLTVELSANPPRGSPISTKIDVPVAPGGNYVAQGGGNTGGGGGKSGDGNETQASTSGPGQPKRLAAFTIGARLGGAYDAQLSPLLGLELAVRPSFASKRMTFFVSADFRTMSSSFSGPQVSGAESSVMRVPVFAGLTVDLAYKNDLRIYLGAGGGVVGVAHRIETDFQDPQVFRRIAPGAEVLAGVAYTGLFLELAGTYMSISDRSLEVPSVGGSAAIGYRLGLF